MSARGTSGAPTPEALATSWLSRYTRVARPLPLRMLEWVPLVVPVSALLGPQHLVPAIIAAVAWFPIFIALAALHDWKYRSLLVPLTELAALPDPTSEQHMQVVALVLQEAHPALTTRPRPTADQVGEVLRMAALTLFVRADATGCGVGHSPVCTHRRNGEAWLRWIAPEEFDSATDPTTSTSTNPMEESS